MDRDEPASVASWLKDLAVLLCVLACLIGIVAHGPSDTYANAQLQQVGAVIGTLRSGDWLLPRDQLGGFARKPQLYAWVDAAILAVTGIYDDFTFRLPTVLSAMATLAVLYGLGRRWYGRAAALTAGLLWATLMHMNKQAYVALTDMMLTLWITLAFACADRLLFHPAPKPARMKFAAGFWAAMILAAMTKGWGILNLVVVGLSLAVASGAWGGFKALRRVRGPAVKAALACRLVGRRWRATLARLRIGWGLLAMAAVLVPVWIGMFRAGGEEFREIVKYEFFARVTGQGEAAPHARSTPAVLNLLYYTLPASWLALTALALTPVRNWFTRRSAIALPLAWIVGVTLPFSLTHGFRPDYLLPCYGAVALMGGWAVAELSRRARTELRASLLRHAHAGATLLVGIAIIVLPAIYLLHEHLPKSIAAGLRMPALPGKDTWAVAACLPVAGAAIVVAGVRASLRWRLHALAALAAAGMLGVAFMDTHFISRHARTNDGEYMRQFGLAARQKVGADGFAVFCAEKLGTELYLGWFGRRIEVGPGALSAIDVGGQRWLITCDKGLVILGASREQDGGEYSFRDGKRTRSFQVLPQDLGEVRLQSQPIFSQGWGRIYLIELRRPPRVSGTGVPIPYISGKPDE